MGWVRTRRGLGGWLALFALALQLVLSFGHIHPEDFAAAQPAAAVSAHAGDRGGAPNGGSRHDGNHDDCPICAVMHLAGTLLLAAPPQVPLPASHPVAPADVAQGQAPLCARGHAFQARGPPQA